MKKEIKEKTEDWEKEFNKRFPNLWYFYEMGGGGYTSCQEDVKSFIRQEKQKWIEEINELPRIEITYKDGSKSRAILEHSWEIIIKK